MPSKNVSRRRDVAEGEVRGDRMLVERAAGRAGSASRALISLREHEPPAAGPVEQWLLSDAVAAEHQAAAGARPIPQTRTCRRDAARAPPAASSSARCAITSVSPRERNAWPSRFETRAQLAEVVDLAVEDDGDGLPSSFVIGGSPVSRSMIASRFWPMTARSAAKLPRASGPRWSERLQLCVDDRPDVAGLGPRRARRCRTSGGRRRRRARGHGARQSSLGVWHRRPFRRSPRARPAPDQRRRSASATSSSSATTQTERPSTCGWRRSGRPGALQADARRMGLRVVRARSRRAGPVTRRRRSRLLVASGATRIDVLQTHLLDGSLVGLTAARLARTPVALFTAHHSHEIPLLRPALADGRRTPLRQVVVRRHHRSLRADGRDAREVPSRTGREGARHPPRLRARSAEPRASWTARGPGRSSGWKGSSS